MSNFAVQAIRFIAKPLFLDLGKLNEQVRHLHVKDEADFQRQLVEILPGFLHVSPKRIKTDFLITPYDYKHSMKCDIAVVGRFMPEKILLIIEVKTDRNLNFKEKSTDTYEYRFRDAGQQLVKYMQAVDCGQGIVMSESKTEAKFLKTSKSRSIPRIDSNKHVIGRLLIEELMQIPQSWINIIFVFLLVVAFFLSIIITIGPMLLRMVW